MSIPVALEVFVPTVAEALLKISTTLPMWTNVVEKILALRCDERRMLCCEMREMRRDENHDMRFLVVSILLEF